MSKIIVRWNNECIDYFLLKGVKLSTHTDVLCQLFRVDDNPDKYALFFREHNLFLSDGILNDPDTSNLVQDNSLFELNLAPIHHVDSILECLNSENTLKKGLLGLKSHLPNSNFMREFLKKGGMNILQSIIMDISGNTLSFALSVFEIAISNPDFQIELLSVKVIEKIITLLDHSIYNVNISNPLKIALKLTQSKEGYRILINTIASMNKNTIYSKIINNLNSTDVNTQTFSLSLINNMIAYSENVPEFLDEIEEYNLSNILKKQLNTTDIHFKKQIYRLQNLKLQEFIRDCSTQYSKDDPNHEKLLEKLWDIMFVGETFQPVDERWKSIGFQGKDPSTDFRGMGIAGLKHLLYLANNHLDSFKNITQHQTVLQSNPLTSDRYYPVAVCGIHITSMLLELMRPPPNIKENEENILPILFDHKNAVEEIYCITLDIFEMVWEEAVARYMDFERVKTVLKSQITETITKATTIMGFRTNNTGRKKLVDYKKLVSEICKKNGSGSTRQSKSFNSGYEDNRKSSGGDHTGNPLFSRSTDSQHELLSKSYSTEECQDFDNTHISISSFDGNTPLHSSISSHSFESVNQLLGNNLHHHNHPNTQGMTPVNLACTTSTIQIIELIMVQNGINVTLPAKNGYHPIHSLASRKWIAEDFSKVLKILLEKGVEIDTKITESMDTPLHLAVAKECEDNVRILLGSGSTPNYYNRKGETPLHIAIAKKNREIIELLIKYGADPAMNNSQTNEACEDMCGNDQDLVNLLRNAKDKYRTPDEAHPKKPAPLPKRPSISAPKDTPSISICSPASSNRSITPSPSTSPSVTSPSIKSATPIRHTNSVIGLQYEPSSSPTSPIPVSRPSSNISNSPPDLNIGSNGSGSNSSGGTNTFMNLLGRATTPLRASGLHLSTSPNGVHAPISNTKQIELTKKKMSESISLLDQLVYTTEPKMQKETVKKTVENLKTCISNLKGIKFN